MTVRCYVQLLSCNYGVDAYSNFICLYVSLGQRGELRHTAWTTAYLSNNAAYVLPSAEFIFSSRIPAKLKARRCVSIGVNISPNLAHEGDMIYTDCRSEVKRNGDWALWRSIFEDRKIFDYIKGKHLYIHSV